MPVLAAPDFARSFKSELYASAYGAGAVLFQEYYRGIDHPVCYFSKTFNKHQVTHNNIEKDAVVLVLSKTFFEVYVGSLYIQTITL